MRPVGRYGDDALALCVVDHLLAAQPGVAATVHVAQELQDVRLADAVFNQHFELVFEKLDALDQVFAAFRFQFLFCVPLNEGCGGR